VNEPIATDGIHAIAATDYHGDPCEQPSLSAGLVSILLNQSPRHAWYAHPRLNPDWRPRVDQKFDVGTVAHQVLLEGQGRVVIVEADNWRTKVAQETQAEAREAGYTPLLAADWQRVVAMVDAAREQLPRWDLSPTPFTRGKPEQALIWHEPNGVTCRALVDWLHDPSSAAVRCVSDYKTTSASANPEAWTRNTLYRIGADVQVAFYLRGLERLTGERYDWRYVVQENFPPYALSVISLAPSVIELANAKIDAALDLWQRCVTTDSWPAYPERVCWAELPAWEEARWLEKEAREAA